VLGQPRSTQRYRVKRLPDEELLTVRVCELSSEHPEYRRYGYRRVTALLRTGGWGVNHKRVERIWRQEGLKVPQKQQKRRRLWLNDTASIRLRPVRRNHV
jgi:putative transposase